MIALNVQLELLPQVSIETHKSMMVGAFVNLVTNAVEAVQGRKGARVTLSAVPTPEGVEITLRDSGVGMGAEALARIATLHQTAGKAQGHGYGLWITKQVFEAAGIRLNFDSQPGQFTQVTVTVPGSN
jgi:signal transduction histidine kinase